MDLAQQLMTDIQHFKKANKCDRVVIVWCGSTEKYQTQAAVHQSWAAFERGLQEIPRHFAQPDLRLRRHEVWHPYAMARLI